MKNALAPNSVTPPAPNPDARQINGQSGAPNDDTPQMAAMPAPNHQQTVAALKHCDAIERELTVFLVNPDLGKADLRSEFIDGATKLVAEGIMTAAQAVQNLASIPQRPYDQKKWVEQQFLINKNTADAVLAHHQAAFAGQPAPEQTGPVPDHQTIMSGLISHYKGLKKKNA